MMKELITHQLYWNDHYVGPTYAFDTTRKSHAVVQAMDPRSSIADPAEHMLETAEDWISNTISAEYINALKTGSPSRLAESNCFDWCPAVWGMALHSTAGVLAAADIALEEGIAGSLSSGIHHAHLDRGSGFCTINAFAVLANNLKNRRIVILDFDAHNGGGTVKSLRKLGIDNRVEQWDLSTDTFDEYRQDATHQIVYADDDGSYLAAAERLTSHVVGADLVVYNAGVDPYPEISHRALEKRDEIVFSACVALDVPCMYVLAGGYTVGQTMEELVMSHMATIRQADLHYPGYYEWEDENAS